MRNQSEINMIAIIAATALSTLVDVLCEKGVINEKEFLDRCGEDSEKLKEKTNGFEN